MTRQRIQTRWKKIISQKWIAGFHITAIWHIPNTYMNFENELADV